MQVQIEELNPTRRKIAVEVPLEAVRSEIDRAFGRVQQTAQIRGFRPGRVPRSVLEKYFGDQVRADVLSHLIERSYADAVEQADLRPVGAPEIVPESLETGKPLRFSATVDVLPKLEVTDYQGLAAKRPIRYVTDEDVASALERLRESLAELRPIEGRDECREGDFASIDYVASVDGRPLPEGSRENRLVEVGKGSTPREIEQALVGLQIGEKRTAEVSFPADVPDEAVAGKAVRFEVTLRALRERVLPALDDELAKEHGECATLDELRGKLRERIAASIRRQGDEQVREQLIDELLRRNSFEVPKSLVERQVDAFVEELLERLGGERAQLEKDGARLEQLRDDYRPRAERQVRAVLALDRLAEAVAIDVSEEDVTKRIADTAEQAGAQAAKVREVYREPAARAELKSRILRERALEEVVARAAIEEVTVPPSVVAPPGETG